MSQRYGEKPIQMEYDEIKKCDSPTVPVGGVVTVDVVESGPNEFGTIVKDTQTYYLERVSRGYLILWEPSVNWLPLGWDAYLASRPVQPMTFPLLCSFSDSYFSTGEKIKRTHYSLRVTPLGESRGLNAFVAKESPAGRTIFETLRDGQPHVMLLAIQFRKDVITFWVTQRTVFGLPGSSAINRTSTTKAWRLV